MLISFAFRLLVVWLISLVPLLAMAQGTPTPPLSFQFKLDADYRTSAAVYEASSGKLVRTLWRGVRFESGTHTAAWDGKDDAGAPRSVGGSYIVRVLANNVRYVWEGVIGNTGANFTGQVYSNPHNNVAVDACYAQVGAETRVYFTNGSAEGGAQVFRFSTASPQTAQIFAPLYALGFHAFYGALATDDEWLYAGSQAGDANLGTHVRAWTLANEQVQDFPAGTPLTFPAHPTLTSTTISCASVDTSSAPKAITGLAVQRDADGVLAVARRDANRVDLLNKKTGALLKSLTVTAPERIAFKIQSPQDQLWIIGKSGSAYQVYCYQVGRASTINSGSAVPLLTTISTVAFPLALSVSPVDNSLLIAAGDPAQQVLRFSAQGTPLSPAAYGVAGGYRLNGPDAALDKFQFHLPFQPGPRWPYKPATMLTAMPDGSFWVADGAPQYGGTSRLIHVSSSLAAIEQVAFLVASASVAVNKNNSASVFWDYLEFEVDYSKPLLPGDPMAPGGNQSWKLKKNWGAALDAKFQIQTNHPDPSFSEGVVLGFRSVVTLGSGANQRTYALAQLANETQDYGYYLRCGLLELPSTGPARDTGIVISDKEVHPGEPQSRAYKLQADGSLRYGLQIGYESGTSGTQEFRYLPFQGLVASGGDLNPSWGGTFNFLTGRFSNEGSSVFLGSTPITTQTPIWPGNASLPLLPSGRLVVFDTSGNPGLHVGTVGSQSEDPTSFRSLFSPAVPDRGFGPPNGIGSFETLFNGAFEIMTAGSHMVYGVRGEFYHGSAAQADQWIHFYDEGLFVGQFGTYSGAALVSPFGIGLDLDVSLAGCGAPSSAVMTTGNQERYVYANDEGSHGGLHRWHLAGADAMKLYEGTGTLSPKEGIITLAGHGLAPAGATQAPLDLRGALNGNGSIDLAWAAVSGATSYEVYHGATASNLDQLVSVSASSTPSANVGSLPAGSRRFFAVRAVTGTSKSAFSHIVSLVPLADNFTNRTPRVIKGGMVLASPGMFPMPVVEADPVAGARQFPTQLVAGFEHIGTLLRTDIGSRAWALFNPSQTTGGPNQPDLLELRSVPSGYTITTAADLITAGWTRFDGAGYTSGFGYDVSGFGVTATVPLQHCSLVFPTADVDSPAVTITVPDSRWRLLTVLVPVTAEYARDVTVTLTSLAFGGTSASHVLARPAPSYNGIVQFYFTGDVALKQKWTLAPGGIGGAPSSANLGAIFIDDLPISVTPKP